MAILATAAQAPAAVEVGGECDANGRTGPKVVVPYVAAPEIPLPMEVPEAGIVTSWSLSSILPPGNVLPQSLRVAEATANPDIFRIVAESATEAVPPGVNTFKTRIPVKAGVRFGLYGDEGAFVCSQPPGSVTGWSEENVFAGSIGTFEAMSLNVAVPVSAIVEPDADGDGFGDETQDACPGDPARHADCQTIGLSALATAQRRSVTVLATTTRSAPVGASGIVHVPRLKGEKAKPVWLEIPTTAQQVSPGQLGYFSLDFPKRLQAVLAALPKRRSLAMTVTTTATNPAGQGFSQVSEVRLQGQKRDPRPAHSRR